MSEVNFWKANKIMLNVTLLMIITSTVCGVVYVSDSFKATAYTDHDVTSMHFWKRQFPIPVFSSLPLLLNVMHFYLAHYSRKMTFLKAKLAFDIVGTIVQSGWFAIWIKVQFDYHECMTRKKLVHSSVRDTNLVSDFYCYSDTIYRVRLEYILIWVMLIACFVNIVVLFFSIAMFCVDCQKLHDNRNGRNDERIHMVG